MSDANRTLSSPCPVGRVRQSTVGGLKFLAEVLRNGRTYASRRAIAAELRLSSPFLTPAQR
jgi:hypothetical protein